MDLRQQNIFSSEMHGCDCYRQLTDLVAVEFNACDAHVDWAPLVAPPLLLSLLVSKQVRFRTIIQPS